MEQQRWRLTTHTKFTFYLSVEIVGVDIMAALPDVHQYVFSMSAPSQYISPVTYKFHYSNLHL